MVDYYTNRRNANGKIDAMLMEGIPIPQIYWKIDLLYGFGKKFVDNRIEVNKEMIESTKHTEVKDENTKNKDRRDISRRKNSTSISNRMAKEK